MFFEEETQSKHLQDHDYTPSQSASIGNFGHIETLQCSRNMEESQSGHLQDQDHLPS